MGDISALVSEDGMSDGIEIPGEVLAQAVVASAIGRSQGGAHAAHAAHDTNCANCGSALAGRYCAQCGQSAHVHRSLLHMGEELLHGIFHFETKAWRTLPLLLFRPGRLTREFIEGKRVRYVAPLPLFLFMMFLMFMTFSLTSHQGGDTKLNEKGQKQAQAAATELAKVRAELAALPASDARRDEDEARIRTLESKIAGLTLVPGIVQINSDDDDEEDGTLVSQAPKDGSKKERPPKTPLTVERLHKEFLDNGMTWLATPNFERKVVHAMNNKELALYKIKGGAAKFAILLVPITLPFLWLLFIFRRQYKMFDHAVFSFYSLSAMALWMTLVAVLGALGFGGTAAMVACFAPPIHMFVQLRGAYALSRWGALWRTLALSVWALLALLAYFLIVVAVSM